ncbi:unnamed protein product [Prorocentrum cordatum]|uniref:Uncharacterized protein n=1 Tax=Prorocentrum cordatum TaxID=2364126 RepID=A0ABN9X545_9DINO|nr:unnamed protein product [Polarella glacialis]
MSTMAEPLGFPPGADVPEIAANALPRARDVPRSDADAHESQSGDEYLPDVEGYCVQFADGTESRIRFERVSGKWCPTFRVPNRDIPVLANESMDSIAARVLDMFETPGIQLGFSKKGLLALRGFHTIFNARCAQARNADRVSLSARLGIAPWHLAMLSAGLAILEVGRGAREPPELALAPAAPGAGGPDGVAGEAPAGEEVPAAQGVPEEVDEGIRGPHYPDFIEDTHVVRAYKLFAVLDAIRSCWHPRRGADTPEERLRRAEVAEEQASLQQVRGPPVASDGAAEAGFLDYAPSQTQPGREPRAEASAAAAAEPSGGAGEGGSQVAPAASAPAARGAAGAPQCLLPTGADVPAMDVGFGVGGASVQTPIPGVTMVPDRQLMQRVLLRGEALVSLRKVCDAVKMKPDGSSAQVAKPMGLKSDQCAIVVKAALDLYNVAEFDPQGWVTERDRGAAVRLRLPNPEDGTAVAKYHNLLMKCCRVSYSQHLQVIKQREERGGDTNAREDAAGCFPLASAPGRLRGRGILLLVGGWKKIVHFPKRCHNVRCGRKYRAVWCNYIQIGTSRHWHCHDGDPLYFFFNSTIGFSSEWLRQFHCRLAYQHVSFMSEAQTHLRTARMRGVASLVPTRSDDYMAKVWILWRALVRAHARAVQSGADPVDSVGSIDLAVPAPGILRGIGPWYHGAMEAQRARQFHAGEKDATLLVMDGNQKLRRRVCGYPYCERVHSKSLGLGMWRCCSETPAQQPGKTKRSGARGSDAAEGGEPPPPHGGDAVKDGEPLLKARRQVARCPAHASATGLPGPRARSYDILSHRQKSALTDSGRPVFELEVRYKFNGAWLPADQLNAAAVHAYLSTIAVSGNLSQHSDEQSLGQSSCKTHKEDIKTKRMTARSGGWLFAISASGCIVHLDEFMGAESITQRYMFVARCCDMLPGLEVLVHDDACHLCRFALLRDGQSDMATNIAKLRYITDPFHSKGHVWNWCLENCAPTLPGNAARLAGVNANACEHRFRDLGRYRENVNAMGKEFARFFLTEMMDFRNVDWLRRVRSAP